MYRVGIIGSENFHATEFTNIFNNSDKYPEIKVVGIAGDYPESNQKINQAYGVKIYENYLDMLGEVDAVMVTARDGKYHAKFAKPFIEAGIPVFIDKPLTVDGKEAKELLTLAKNNNVLVLGGSSLKYIYDVLMLKNVADNNKEKITCASLVAPLNMNNEYSGFYFYSAHLAEMCLKIFGYNPIEVTARRNKDSVMAIVKYEGFNVCLQFGQMCGHYQGQIIYDTVLYSRNIDISICYKHECDAFYQMLKTGEMPSTYTELAKAVYFLNAIYQSYTTEQTVKIENVEI